MGDTNFFNRLRPYATEQVTIDATAGGVGLTAAKVDNSANYPDFKAAGAVLALTGADIYYTLDGTTPSSTNGIGLFNGDVLPLAGYQKVKNFKGIRQGSTSATLNVQYFKN